MYMCNVIAEFCVEYIVKTAYGFGRHEDIVRINFEESTMMDVRDVGLVK